MTKAVETPTTWKHARIVHEVTHVQAGVVNPVTDKARLSFRTTCGRYEAVDDSRAFVKVRDVNCLECIATPVPPLLRGKTADMVWFDEAQDINFTNPCGEIALDPKF